ncbi:MAG TPA: hypothetical protein VJC18_05370, partial [bacterium]|nr:hypothetical protein [bacterium]
EHEDQPLLKRTFAAQLHRSGLTNEAITVLDKLVETLMQKGDRQGAMEVINQIILMNPPNVENYRQILNQMKNS